MTTTSARASIVDDKRWTEEELAFIPRMAMYLPSAYDDAFRVHPTVEMAGLKIDEQMAPLVGILWELGIKTCACCQGHALDYHISHSSSGAAYIMFKDYQQAANFVRYTAEKLPARYSNKIVLTFCSSAHSLGDGLVNFPPLLVDTITDIWRTGV